MKKLLFPDVAQAPSLTGTENCSCFEMFWEEGEVVSPDEYDLSNLEFICETLPMGKMTDYGVTDLGAPIVSEKLRELMGNLGKGLQYFPAKVYEKGGLLAPGNYYAVNIPGMVDCIDFDASDLVTKERNGKLYSIREVRTMVLDNGSYGDIYRVHHFWRLIVVEAALVALLDGADITGLKLIEPERWDGFLSEKPA